MPSVIPKAAPRAFLIVDDHPLFAEALTAICVATFPNAKTAHALNLDEARKALRGERFDVILVDLCLPDVIGLEGLIEIHKTAPRQKVVVISTLEDARVAAAAVMCGASGYIYKSLGRSLISEALRDIANNLLYLPPGYSGTLLKGPVKSVAEGINALTLMQFRALMLLKRGQLNKQIAHTLDVREATAKAHVSEVLRKLGVSSRTRAVIDVSRLDFDRLAPGAVRHGR